MITALAQRLTEYIMRKTMCPQIEPKACKRVFEIIVIHTITLIGILIISYFMGIMAGAIVFLLGFIPLQLTTCRLYKKHRWLYIIIVTSVCLTTVLIVEHMGSTFAMGYVLFGTLLSSLIIAFLSPIFSENIPIVKSKKLNREVVSMIIASVNLAAVLFAYYISKPLALVLVYYVTGSLSASILHIIADIATRSTERANQPASPCEKYIY